jgi:hypothetical protein
MRRNLAIVITLAAAAAAQTPTVVEKPAAKATTVKVAPAAQSSKPSPATVKPAAAHSGQPAVVSVAPRAGQSSSGTAAKPAVASPAASKVAIAAPKPAAPVAAKPAAVSVSAKPKLVAVPAAKTPKAAAVTPAKANKPTPVVAKPEAKPQVAVREDQDGTKDKKPAKDIHMAGRRDPFVSPIVNLGAVGSGCSSGKRCLTIDQIILRGVVKSDSGMIAVVVNSMDKAYFLRENDPVFNGYVLKITGDSIVFKETLHDRVGKPLTRDVTKTITRPAV